VAPEKPHFVIPSFYELSLMLVLGTKFSFLSRPGITVICQVNPAIYLFIGVLLLMHQSSCDRILINVNALGIDFFGLLCFLLN
jgi:hypothetical protein